MKRLVALMMCAVSLGAAAQIDWDFPYNPDGNSDGYIFSEDLLDLLALYGQQFNSEEVFLDQDSSHLILKAGDELTRIQCVSACLNLEGAWRVVNYEDVARFYDFLTDGLETFEDLGISEANYPGLEYIWIDSRSNSNQLIKPFEITLHRKNTRTNDNGIEVEENFGEVQIYNYILPVYGKTECWCATKQRPRVEFDRVNALSITEWAEFLNQKASEGWYILPQPVPAADTQSVTFWRWAE